MRVYISVDMEGVAGIMDSHHWEMDGLFYQRSADLMVEEANAAIEGAIEAGATDIIVNDSHHKMINLDPSRMHPAAKVIQGRIKPMSMCQGMGPGFDAAMYIGYHAGRGAKHAVLDHTYTGILHDVRINGRSANEAHLNGLVAGHFGCPVVFVSGDQALKAEMEAWNPRIHCAVVKECFGRQAVQSVHPTVARQIIREGAIKALGQRGEIPIISTTAPITLEIEFVNAQMGDICERVVGLERIGGRTVRAQSDDVLTIFRYFLTSMSMAGTVA